MKKIIAIANQKGGVGKTSTCINLGASLAHFSQETLLIDSDPQGNTTSGIGLDKKTSEKTLYQVLLGELKLDEVIQPTSVSWLDVIPAGAHLVGAEAELMGTDGRELILQRHLETFNRAYRYLLIDCPPSLGLLTINALAAADSVLIPVQCEYYALEGLAQLLETIEVIRERLNPRLAIEGVLFTMVDQRMNLTQQVIEEVKKFFGEKVLSTQIPRAIRVAEAPGFGKPLLIYARDSRATEAYLQLAKEIISKQLNMEVVKDG
ncbi:MAG: ParA family protein [Elusimicrobia bacterium]|nr:ParA family protein [Elusimicrobiota bacterium]